MEYYISYHKLIKFMEQVQQNSPRLKSFGHGDLVYFSENTSGQTNIYPYMFVTPQLVTYNESTTQYQLNIIFADIVNTDLSNEIDVISDMSIEAKNLIAAIYRGFLFNELDIELPSTATPFMERFNDHVGGVELNLTITIFDDINACVMYEAESPTPTPTATVTPTVTPTNTPTPTVTATVTPTPTCSTTQQYMEVELSENTKFKLILWNTSGFTSPATALCDYSVSGTAYGSLGTVYNGVETIDSGQHQHQFDLAPVLQPGETVTAFTVSNLSTATCACPVNVDYSPYIPPSPTPTPTSTITPTPTVTPTSTPTAISSEYRTSFQSGSNLTTYTFTGLTTGGEGLIAVSFTWESAAGLVSGVTIGGITATLAAEDTAPGPGVATYYVVTTASTVDVVITFTEEILRVIGGMWRITDYISSTPSSSAVEVNGLNTSASTITITGMTTGSVVLALQAVGTASIPVTWTNATERFDIDAGDLGLRGSGADASGTGTSLTISTTYPTSAQVTKLFGVAWR